jgi:hypothetical protein
LIFANKFLADCVVTALMNVNDCEVRFQLDSAADVNTICKKFVRKDQVRPTSITLRQPFGLPIQSAR